MELCWKVLLTLAFAAAVSQQRTLTKDNEPQSDVVTHENDDGDFPPANCSNRRYIKHYQARGCTASEFDVCSLPTKFDCPSINEIENNGQVCYFNGRFYFPGMEMKTSDPCQRCHCTLGPDVRTLCTYTQCAPSPENTTGNCHDIYELGQCCPTKTVCADDSSEVDESHYNASCWFGGVSYPVGAKLPYDEYPCQVCFCSSESIGGSSVSTMCFQTHCIIEDLKSKLIKGCVPIYEESVCCPVDFYCGLGAELVVSNETVEAEMPEEVDLQCSFLGKSYKIGESVSVSHDATECLTCTCQILPDVTCIRKTCDPNPNENSCFPYYTASSGCCPEYECLLNDANSAPRNGSTEETEVIKREMESEDLPENAGRKCSDVICPDGMSCMLFQVNCTSESCPPLPTCMWTNSSCPTPMCDTGCVVTEQDDHRCPTCLCGDEIERNPLELKCPMPQCSSMEKKLVINDEGCPTCACDKPLSCPTGCNVQTEVEGQCPTCVCEDETEGCPTPVCEHEGCTIENLPNGCPTCICNSSQNDEREVDDGDLSSSDEPEGPITASESSQIGRHAHEEKQQEQQHQQQQRSFDTHDMNPPPQSAFSESQEEDSLRLMSDSPTPGRRTSYADDMTSLYNRNRDAEVPRSKLLMKNVQNYRNNIQSFESYGRFGSRDAVQTYLARYSTDRAKPEP